MLRRLKVICRKFKSDGIINCFNWLRIFLYRRIIPQKQVIWYTDLTRLNTKGFILPDNLKLERYDSMEKISEVDLKSLLEFNSDLMGSATSILIPERFQKGAVLWLLKENGQLAGYRWTIVNNHVTPTYFPHTANDVHSIGIEILPNYRGRDLQDNFQKQMWITLKNEGFHRFYSETHLWNKRAIKAFLKTGQAKVGTATRFYFLGKNIVIWHDMSNKIYFK